MPQPAGPQSAEAFVGRDRVPDGAAYLDQAVKTGTRCSYSAPNRPG
jgi:hypothetical protein